MKLRTLLWVVTLIAGLLVGGLIVWRSAQGPVATTRTTGTALVGGPFQLVNQDGQATTEAALRGRWTVVFFGYTYCPDVCPTTLQRLAQAQASLGDRGRNLQVIFFSVDPQRDTPAQLKAYLSGTAMPRNVTGLTGTPEQVAAAARAYRVFYQRAGTGPSYTVDHSTAAYLMNPQGRFERILPYDMTPPQIAQQISQAMAAAG